jgi:5-methylcytosine-specific restriction endonuclease McrA
MRDYSLSHLTDGVLLRELTALAARDRATTAALLAHIAEVDARRLYAPAGYSAMFHYCVRELRFSEDMAGKRIRAARAARRFPAIFAAIAEGRLHLTAVVLLAPSLTSANAAELLAAAEGRTKEQIQVMLVGRSPRADLAPLVRALPEVPAPSAGSVFTPQVPEPVEVQESSSAPPVAEPAELAPASPTPGATPTGSIRAAPTSPTPPAPMVPARTTPLSPGRFGLQLTMSAETREKLRRAEDLLGHSVPRGDLATVLDRALDALIEKLERRRFARTDRPAPRRRASSSRHVPASVRRAVSARDGDRCTFVSERGERCEERRALEFDHVLPVARGGDSTLANLRLRCRAHNQLEAERTYGAGFMQDRREAARERREREASATAPS